MVAVPGIQGATVTVQVNGEGLTEHDHDSFMDDDHTAHRYIQSEAGKEFSVRIDLDANIRYESDSIGFDVYIDGEFCDGRVFEQSTHRRGVRNSFDVAAALLCPHERTFFRFGALKTDEAAATLSTRKTLSLGCIEIQIAHKKITGPGKLRIFRKSDTEVTIQEKALKGRAMSHAVEFARTEEISRPVCLETTEVSQRGIVRFYYRSRDDLQAMYIIPRTPSPEPWYTRNINSMTQDEVETMQARLCEFEQSASAGKVKRERSGDDESSAFGHNKRRKTKIYLALDDDGSYHEEPAPQPELSSAAESID